MNPRETLVAETQEWLGRARGDLAACDALIAAGLAAEALFHAQQCAEKAMNALLTWHQAPFKKTHDLDELKQSCLPLATGAADQLATNMAFPLPRRPVFSRTSGGGRSPARSRRIFSKRWPPSSNPYSAKRNRKGIANSEPFGSAPALPKD